MLKNLFGLRNPNKLRKREYSTTSKRAREIADGLVDIPRTFDADHIRAIHQYLFQDVYPWAGQFRIVDMAKGGGVGFAACDGGIQDFLDDVHPFADELQWDRLDQDRFGRIAPDAWNFASAMSHPQLVGEPPNPQPLVAVFQQIATPTVQSRAHQASFPTPPTRLSTRYHARSYRPEPPGTGPELGL